MHSTRGLRIEYIVHMRLITFGHKNKQKHISNDFFVVEEIIKACSMCLYIYIDILWNKQTESFIQKFSCFVISFLITYFEAAAAAVATMLFRSSCYRTVHICIHITLMEQVIILVIYTYIMYGDMDQNNENTLGPCMNVISAIYCITCKTYSQIRYVIALILLLILLLILSVSNVQCNRSEIRYVLCTEAQFGNIHRLI